MTKILLVGEAWGVTEEETRQPFVGEAGKELWQMLGEAMPGAPEAHAYASALHRFGGAWCRRRKQWLDAMGIAMTNVFNFRPPGNKLAPLCVPRKELSKDYAWPKLCEDGYLREEFLPEVDRLHAEIRAVKPNLVVALGNTPSWAMLRSTNISQIRGAVTWSALAGVKVLPTYHPAGVLRRWEWRPIVVADLMKARVEGEFPEIRRPARRILADPTMEELRNAVEEALTQARMLASDVETKFGQISMISFAWERGKGLLIPFWDSTKPGGNYWATPEEEREAFDLMARLLESPIPKLFQNGLYDLQYILPLGIRPRGLGHDTMLLHHSHYPELQKGLGFLGSIYTSEPAWKLMRTHKADTEKRDE